MYSAYGNVTELLPHNAPHPLGKPVVTTTYADANLYDKMTELHNSARFRLFHGVQQPVAIDSDLHIYIIYILLY
jgi:hypothetical protein